MLQHVSTPLKMELPSSVRKSENNQPGLCKGSRNSLHEKSMQCLFFILSSTEAHSWPWGVPVQSIMEYRIYKSEPRIAKGKKEISRGVRGHAPWKILKVETRICALWDIQGANLKKYSTLKFKMNISFVPSICIHRSIVLIFIENSIFSPTKNFFSNFLISARIFVPAMNSWIWQIACKGTTFGTIFSSNNILCCPPIALAWSFHHIQRYNRQQTQHLGQQNRPLPLQINAPPVHDKFQTQPAPL